MGRHDAHHGQSVQKRVVGPLHGDLAGHRIESPSLGHHGQVGLSRRPLGDAVDGEGHVLGRKRHPVGEDRVVANGESPGETILRAVVGHGQIVHEGKIVVGGDKGGLDEGLVHMLAGAPAHERIEPGRRLRGGRHSHDHLRFAVRAGASASGRRSSGARRGAFPAAGTARQQPRTRCAGQRRSPHEVSSRQGHPPLLSSCYVLSTRNNTTDAPSVLRKPNSYA